LIAGGIAAPQQQKRQKKDADGADDLQMGTLESGKLMF
jgi:hypothetical protein